MKTLYDKLSDENKQKLNDYGYASLRAELIDALKNNHYWTDLTLGQAILINDPLDDGPLDISNISKLFEYEKRDKDASPK